MIGEHPVLKQNCIWLGGNPRRWSTLCHPEESYSFGRIKEGDTVTCLVCAKLGGRVIEEVMTYDDPEAGAELKQLNKERFGALMRTFQKIADARIGATP